MDSPRGAGRRIYIIFVGMTPTLYSIAVFVSDIDRALAFYRDTLGLPLIRQGSFGGEFLEAEPHLGVHPAAHPRRRNWSAANTGLTFHVANLVHLAGRAPRPRRPLRARTHQTWLSASWP